MNLRRKLIELGVGDYIAIPREANSRKKLNALLYHYLLTKFTIETNVREVCLDDGSNEEWLDGINRKLLPFLRRFAKCRENT